MTSRSEAAERLLAEARESLRERDAEIRGFEQRALETSLALKSKDAALADLEKDLTSARALHAEADSARASSISGRPNSPRRWRPRTPRCSAPNRRS